jgi:molybdopterin converting factor small subunit
VHRGSAEGISRAIDCFFVKIRVQFYSSVRELLGQQESIFDLADGATVADLLEKIYQAFPDLRSRDKSILVGAAVEFVDRSHKLKPGEEISIMPPVQGG